MKFKGGFINNDETQGPAYQYTGLNFQRIRHYKRTRAPHECFECKLQIPKGSEALYYSGRDPMLGFYYHHVCIECSTNK